jgi:hypothetical protein
MFGCVDMGTVGQVVYVGSKFQQRFPGVLDPSPQMSMECFRQVVALVAILKHHSNLLVLRSSVDAM